MARLIFVTDMHVSFARRGSEWVHADRIAVQTACCVTERGKSDITVGYFLPDYIVHGATLITEADTTRLDTTALA